MDEELAQFVRTRARGCCEYCQLPEAVASAPFEIDHVWDVQHGGRTVASNLALACFADNHHKGPNLGSIDPKTGKRAWLFNPRRQKWHQHFRWDGPVLVGRTPAGRTTVAVLQLNAPHRIAQRAALRAEGVFPPAAASSPQSVSVPSRPPPKLPLHRPSRPGYHYPASPACPAEGLRPCNREGPP